MISATRRLLSRGAPLRSAARVGFNGSLRQFSSNKVVTLEEAKKLPRQFEEMSNDVITIMAVLGDQEAREERLIREIMSVDNLSWSDAQPRFREMMLANRQVCVLRRL
jgi:hypothetical protein